MLWLLIQVNLPLMFYVNEIPIFSQSTKKGFMIFLPWPYGFSRSTTHSPCFPSRNITKNTETHPTHTREVIIEQLPISTLVGEFSNHYDHFLRSLGFPAFFVVFWINFKFFFLQFSSNSFLWEHFKQSILIHFVALQFQLAFTCSNSTTEAIEKGVK